MVSNIVEIKARGAEVIGVCYEGTKGLEEVLDDIIFIPRTIDVFAQCLELQYFNYSLIMLLRLRTAILISVAVTAE